MRGNNNAKQVTVLIDEERIAGTNSIPFDASRLRSGVYIYVLRSGSAIESRKMLVLNPLVGR